MIPTEKLDTVFRAAINACRERTERFLELPEGENFVVEYVTDKSWSGYNWYQGGYQSLIQVNTDFPIYIDRAIDLACHEATRDTTSTMRCLNAPWSTAKAGPSFPFTRFLVRNL